MPQASHRKRGGVPIEIADMAKALEHKVCARGELMSFPKARAYAQMIGSTLPIGPSAYA